MINSLSSYQGDVIFKHPKIAGKFKIIRKSFTCNVQFKAREYILFMYAFLFRSLNIQLCNVNFRV